MRQRLSLATAWVAPAGCDNIRVLHNLSSRVKLPEDKKAQGQVGAGCSSFTLIVFSSTRTSTEQGLRCEQDGREKPQSRRYASAGRSFSMYSLSILSVFRRLVLMQWRLVMRRFGHDGPCFRVVALQKDASRHDARPELQPPSSSSVPFRCLPDSIALRRSCERASAERYPLLEPACGEFSQWLQARWKSKCMLQHL